MASMQLSGSASGAGVQIQSGATRSADNVSGYDPTLAAGKDVTSWVKTDSDTAACNLPGGHGYTNGNFDVYWTEAGVQKVRYKVPGTITVNALALDGGSGDSFPASATTGIVVTKQSQLNINVDGDNLAAIALQLYLASQEATTPGHITFYDADDNPILSLLLKANIKREWDITGGATNDFTGAPITYALASNGSSAASATLKAIVAQDISP